MTGEPRIQFEFDQSAPANWDAALARFLLEIVRTDAGELEVLST